jgi:hypothetical protein
MTRRYEASMVWVSPSPIDLAPHTYPPQHPTVTSQSGIACSSAHPGRLAPGYQAVQAGISLRKAPRCLAVSAPMVQPPWWIDAVFAAASYGRSIHSIYSAPLPCALSAASPASHRRSHPQRHGSSGHEYSPYTSPGAEIPLGSACRHDPHRHQAACPV